MNDNATHTTWLSQPVVEHDRSIMKTERSIMKEHNENLFLPSRVFFYQVTMVQEPPVYLAEAFRQTISDS